MPDEIKPVENQSTEVPKTKEEWTKLAKDDPGKFAELTQVRMDTIFRQNKEYQEKLTEMETNSKNMALELERFKTQPPPQTPLQQGEKYGQGRYPVTKEEWNDLWLEDPSLAHKLQNEAEQKEIHYRQEFETKREEGAKLVYQEHPDMFVQEQDETGKPKKDGQGKSILKIDPNTGMPYFQSETEKGKLWIQIYNEDKENWDRNKNTPRLIMAEMERRLRVKGANMVNQGQENLANNDQSGLAPQGVTPPKGSSSKFKSEEERLIAERDIKRGIYKNEDDYFKWRDTETRTFGYAEPNSRPDFTKK